MVKFHSTHPNFFPCGKTFNLEVVSTPMALKSCSAKFAMRALNSIGKDQKLSVLVRVSQTV